MRRMLLLIWATSMLFGAATGFAAAQEQMCTEERITLQAEPERCPCCGQAPVARIMYGLPHYTDELQKAIDERRIVLGGCVISDDDPRWACTFCKAVFYPAQAETGLTNQKEALETL